MEHIHLIGAEDVRTGGNTMRDAADEMRRAANTIDTTMSDFLRRFEESTAAFASAVMLMAEVESMKAENQCRERRGHGNAYGEPEFITVMEKYGMKF